MERSRSFDFDSGGKLFWLRVRNIGRTSMALMVNLIMKEHIISIANFNVHIDVKKSGCKDFLGLNGDLKNSNKDGE